MSVKNGFISTRGGDERTSLEASFDYYFRSIAQGYERPESQYRYKRWILDRAFPELKISIELNGGAGGGYGRAIVCHNCGVKVRARKNDGGVGREMRVPYPSHTGKGAERDAAKSNALQMDGWIALSFTSAQLESDPVGVISTVVNAIKRRKENVENQGKIVDSDRYHLTEREAAVLRLLAEGKTAAAIGFQLGIASRTAELYIRRVREKMGVSSSTAAVAIGVATGLVQVRVS